MAKLNFTLIATTKQVVTEGPITVKVEKPPGAAVFNWTCDTLTRSSGTAGNIFKSEAKPATATHTIILTVLNGAGKVIGKGTFAVTYNPNP